MNCDRIARPYRWIEYAAFGRALERHRFHFLDRLKHCRSALLLGDGDARFAAALLRTNPQIKIHVVDLSAGMLAVSRRRLPPGQVTFLQADALKDDLPSGCDVIVTNFFFDCFTTEQLASFIPRIRTAPECLWIVSEFDQPARGWRRAHASLWLTIMYAFFGLATGLRTRSLPNYREVLKRIGFARAERVTSRAGLICSELWRKPPSATSYLTK